MVDKEQYMVLIDFGEAKILDKADLDDNVSQISRSSSTLSRQDTKSDGVDSYFGRMFTKKEKEKSKKI